MANAYHPLTSFESFTQPIELERLSGRGTKRFSSALPWNRGAATTARKSDKLRNLPRAGVFALVGSALTVAVSLGILLGIDGKPVWPGNGIFNVLQPASLLSAHMSLNAVLIGVALEEGLNIAWWYQATKLSTTIAQLHEIWAIGHSSREALRLWRQFNWVSLAAVLAAISPINGVLLQAAITTPVVPVTTNHTLTVPMVKQLDIGYSAYPAPTDKLWGAYTFAQWVSVWKQVQMTQWTSYATYAYFGSQSDVNGSSYDFGYNNLATYSARAYGAGFDMNCVSSQEAYDLNQGTQEEVYGRIFNSYVDFSPSEPNTINMTFLWKRDAACQGNYEVRTCTLRAATVEYPIEIAMNVSGSPYKGPFFSLAPGSTRRDDRVIRLMPVYEQEGKENTTFGGVAGSLLDYNSYYDIWTYSNGTYQWQASGPFMSAIQPTFPGSTAECSLSFQYSLNQLATYLALSKPTIDTNVNQGVFVNDSNIDPTEILFDRLRQAMFLASVYQGTRPFSHCCAVDDSIPHDDSYFFQDVVASQTLQVAKYRVRWWLWGVSFVITWLTCALAIPLFWGYWLLNRRTSMSPAETARLFNAPVLGQFDEQMDAKAVLRQVGNKKVYQDIRSSTDIRIEDPLSARASLRSTSDYNITSPHFSTHSYSPVPDGAYIRG